MKSPTDSKSDNQDGANQPGLRQMEIEEFLRRIYDGQNDQKRFAFFLGAGCSSSSGIPTAGELVKNHWLPRLRKLLAPDRSDLDQWARETIKAYDPGNPAQSYGALIERLFLTPEERQQEIENLCDGKTPSFGYAVLAQLVASNRNRFNIVLTTNFDDLIADALYLYTEARPLVIHHESLAAFIRPTRSRPLVVKLHGDHRLSPRNTALETKSIEQEIRKNTAMVLNDRGLIFMGYGGADRGIIEMLNGLPTHALPFGVFWIHPNEPLGAIRSWLADRGGYWVKSGPFDEVMLLAQSEFELPHPDQERFNRIFDDYHRKFQLLSASIQDKPVGEAGTEALTRARDEAEARFPDYWKVISEADRYRSSNPDRADELYKQGVEQFPDAAPLLGSYASFLIDHRKDSDRAESMFKRALLANAKDAINLGNYANFLKNYREDFDGAETRYKQAMEANPNNAINLGNYATFLWKNRRDFDGAEAMYKQAMEANPKDATNLGNYADFLAHIRTDLDGAETMYKRAMEVDPNLTIYLANLSGLMLARGKEEGLTHLQRALEQLQSKPYPTVELECAFYLYAHGPAEQRTKALETARRLIESGVRSPGWDMSRNVQRAQEDKHPESQWLEKLAKVIGDEAEVEVLNNWSAWANIKFENNSDNEAGKEPPAAG